MTDQPLNEEVVEPEVEAVPDSEVDESAGVAPSLEDDTLEDIEPVVDEEVEE